MRYSLADYIVTVDPVDPNLKSSFGSSVSVGGQGSATDSISVELDDDLWSTTGYATGGWVHDKNLSRTGKVTISLSQLTNEVARFKQLINFYYNSDYSGLSIIVSTSSGKKVASCHDCYPTKIPAQTFGKNAADQSWSFTSGKITFY